jgi:hypothetical protein
MDLVEMVSLTEKLDGSLITDILEVKSNANGVNAPSPVLQRVQSRMWFWNLGRHTCQTSCTVGHSLERQGTVLSTSIWYAFRLLVDPVYPYPISVIQIDQSGKRV